MEEELRGYTQNFPFKALCGIWVADEKKEEDNW